MDGGLTEPSRFTRFESNRCKQKLNEPRFPVLADWLVKSKACGPAHQTLAKSRGAETGDYRRLAFAFPPVPPDVKL